MRWRAAKWTIAQFHPLGPAALAVAAAAAILPADQLDNPALRSPKVVVPVAAIWMGVWLVRFLRAPRAARGEAETSS